MSISAFHYQADREAVHLQEQAALDARVPRSVILSPDFSPPNGALVIAPSIAKGSHQGPAQFIKPLDTYLPQLEEYPSFRPGLKAVMRCRMRAQFGVIEGLLLAAGAQDIIESVGTGTIGHARPPSAKAMGVDADGQEGCNTTPSSSEIRKPVVVRLLGMRGRLRG